MLLKYQMNLRLSSDANISLSGETFVEGKDDAAEAGKEACITFTAFIDGYGEQVESES